MEPKPVAERLAELLRLPQRWMIMDEEGNYHELNSGVRGKTVLGSSAKDLYKLYFGKEKITETEMILLDELHTSMMQFMWDNLSEELQQQSREVLKPLLEKYQIETPYDKE